LRAKSRSKHMLDGFAEASDAARDFRISHSPRGCRCLF
jgi:hypothetical protein